LYFAFYFGSLAVGSPLQIQILMLTIEGWSHYLRSNGTTTWMAKYATSPSIPFPYSNTFGSFKCLGSSETLKILPNSRTLLDQAILTPRTCRLLVAQHCLTWLYSPLLHLPLPRNQVQTRIGSCSQPSVPITPFQGFYRTSRRNTSCE
jgi:hypothetical protein